MTNACDTALRQSAGAPLGFFERYLTLWVFLCIAAGTVLGLLAPQAAQAVGAMEVAQVNIPVGVLIWVMIYPMMVAVDFSSLRRIGERPRGLVITIVVNWLIKPFTMAGLGILFFELLFRDMVDPQDAKEYIAGMILLGAAPCTAMVFVWSQLTRGDATYTLVQVSLNDIIMVIAFAPIVALLLGVTDVIVPWQTLILSVVLYVVIPLAAGYATRRALHAAEDPDAVTRFTGRLKPYTIIGLLATIVLLFGLARLMLIFHPGRPKLADVLDLETSGLLAQAGRVRMIRPSTALAAAALVGVATLAAWQMVPQDRGHQVQRSAFAMFPTRLGAWEQRGPEERLRPDIARTLGADDYRQATLIRDAATPPVGLFMAFYHDQSKGGIHSPEICLPSSGWEIAKLERVDISPRLGIDGQFMLNRAIIQKGESRMMVYYWFQQGERRVAWDVAAKFYLLMDGIRTGQTDGGIVRLTTVMGAEESEESAEARLLEVTQGVIAPLPKFMPEGD